MVLGTSFYHNGSHYGFLFFRCPTSFYNRPIEMDIHFIDETHATDINIPNEPFPISGRMVVTYNGDGWKHTEKLLPPDQITEMTFPEENYQYQEMKNYIFIGAYEGEECVGLAVLTPIFNPCLFLYDLKVKSKMRGKGIGKQLVDASYRFAKENGYAGLYTVGQDNNEVPPVK